MFPRLLPPLLAFAAAVSAVPGQEPQLEWSSPPFLFRYAEAFLADARSLEAKGRRLLPGMAADLGVQPPALVEVWIVAARESGSRVPDWAAGYVPAGSTSIVIVRSRLGSYPSLEIEGVFLHELTHVLIHSALRERSDDLPRWFEEGVAMLQSRRWGVRDMYQVSSAYLRGDELPLAALARRFPRSEGAAQAAYAQSFAFLSHLVRRHGDDLPRRILAAVRRGDDFGTAFRDATGRTLEATERSWRDSMIWKYRWIPILTSNGLLFSGLGLLFLLSYLRKRSQVRRTLERWDRYEPPDYFP